MLANRVKHARMMPNRAPFGNGIFCFPLATLDLRH
jgi:hypothetical protein